MKKILVMLLMICVMASMVTGCGFKKNQNNNTTVEDNAGTGVNDGTGNDADAVPNNNVDNAIDTVPDDTTNNNATNNNGTNNNGTDNSGVVEDMGEGVKDTMEDVGDNIKDTADNVADDMKNNNGTTNNTTTNNNTAR